MASRGSHQNFCPQVERHEFEHMFIVSDRNLSLLKHNLSENKTSAVYVGSFADYCKIHCWMQVLQVLNVAWVLTLVLTKSQWDKTAVLLMYDVHGKYLYEKQDAWVLTMAVISSICSSVPTLHTERQQRTSCHIPWNASISWNWQSTEIKYSDLVLSDSCTISCTRSVAFLPYSPSIGIMSTNSLIPLKECCRLTQNVISFMCLPTTVFGLCMSGAVKVITKFSV